MIESLKQLCKEQANMLQSASLITIHQNHSNHSDFLTVSFLLHALIKGKEVTFLATRENYAHFLALSKKMGKSIQQFGKSGKLMYYEAFASELCSQLPLTQNPPSSFVRPPKFVNIVTLQSLDKVKIKPHSIFIMDCLSFVEHQPMTCYKLYEEAVLAKCQIIIGGCTLKGGVSQIVKREADLWIKLENDVSGHGKFTIVSGYDQNEIGILWKWVQGKFQLSKFMKV